MSCPLCSYSFTHSLTMLRVNVLRAFRRYFWSMSSTRLLLLLSSCVLIAVSVPIDILRQQYVWSVLDREQEKNDMYRRLIGHCECFTRDESGMLPQCVRAYSTVWIAVTLLQFFITIVLLLLEKHPYLLQLLSGAYAAIITVLFTLFVDCGVLTEDDCGIVYLLLPPLVYSCALLVYTVRQAQSLHLLLPTYRAATKQSERQ